MFIKSSNTPQIKKCNVGDLNILFQKACSKRTFLFLQGPHGKFFKKLSNKLSSFRYPTYNICFNGGDSIDKPISINTYYFSKPREYFSLYIKEILINKQITDVFLYGDKRYYHTIAMEICKKLDITIWVFEEGYLRPGYITLEKNGVNSNSNIPSIYNEWLSKQDFKFINFDNSLFSISNENNDEILENPMKTRVKNTIINYLGLWFLYPFFSFYKWHRDKGFTYEILGWGQKKLTDLWLKNKDKKITENFFNMEYFAFPLQLSSDAQIKCASSFRDVSESVEKVISSFSKHANKNYHLIIKLHPLDNSLFNYRKFVCNLAKSFNIEQRIHFINDANSNDFIDNCLGTIVINSTMGILSIFKGKPTITLGNAIYANYGLATSAVTNGVFNEKILDMFWNFPKPPAKFCVDFFYNLIINKAILLGNFYTNEGIEQSLKGVLQRINIKGIKNCHILSNGIKKIQNIDIFLENINKECVIGWGHKKTAQKAMAYAKKRQLPYYALEDGFIKSVGIDNNSQKEIIFSLVLDRIGIYYNAFAPSELEEIIYSVTNSPNLSKYKDQGKILIDLIKTNNLIKYNSIQIKDSINTDSILSLFSSFSSNDPKVLLMDQTYGDSSVTLGNASVKTFKEMLSDAIAIYGNKNVYVKIHPNVINQKARGYYSLADLKKLNVNIIASNVNTLELCKNFNNVYVVTSGSGLEALIAGCEVTCFGEPFYSGYGLTIDKKDTVRNRRINKINSKISLDILVYSIYFEYSIFIDPIQKKQISPIDATNKIINIFK